MARIEKYIPVGSLIVLRQPNAKAVWYTTKKEVVLQNAATVETCPITSDMVRTETTHGIQIWFKSGLVKNRMVLAAGDVIEKAFDEQFSLFHYDIPVNSEFPNPSDRLYSFAIRLTESAWVVRTSDVPYQMMSEMHDAGCIALANKFDKSESRRLVIQAIAKLQEELAEAVNRANQSQTRANQRMEAATTQENPITVEEAERNHLRQAKAIEKRLSLLGSQISAAAARFGINEQAVNISRLGSVASSISSSMRSQAAAYVAAQNALRAAGTSDAIAVANAADDTAAEKVPVYVMADMVRESGNDAVADQLQVAFADGDGTFSLVSGDATDAE